MHLHEVLRSRAHPQKHEPHPPSHLEHSGNNILPKKKEPGLKAVSFAVLIILLAVTVLINPQYQLSSLCQFQTQENVLESPLQTVTDMLDKIDNQLHSWMRNAPTLASKLNPLRLPSEIRPFTFFHIRKGGGSSLRKIISDAAIEHNLQAWVPCYNPVQCVPFSLPPADPNNRTLETVYASHLNYVEMAKYVRETRNSHEEVKTAILEDRNKSRSTTFHFLDDEYPLFDCMTNVRPTVSRVRSCWNYRFRQTGLKNWNVPPANDLSPKDWETLLPQIMDQFNNGCNNEIARIFGSTTDENAVNQMTIDDPNFLTEFSKIAARLSRCVIIRVDRCEESNRIVSHFFPWMNKTNICRKSGLSNTGLSKPAENVLQQNVSDVILKLNYMDEKLFQFAEVLFEEQYKIASAGENGRDES